ncbi:exonuclease GOR-like [Palaemon carinicauda]|uniref:exonuclease GOR-like n=1 Tax=Palaemon carinicauda TaxID=392227 RepID=UPI0035B64805
MLFLVQKVLLTVNTELGRLVNTSCCQCMSSTYEKFRKPTLQLLELEAFGFPRIHPEDASKALVLVLGTAKQPNDSTTQSRICRRCHLEFEVDEEGNIKEVCIFHPYRLCKRKYGCCGLGEGELPCRKAPKHVHDHVNIDEMTGFTLTLKHLYYQKAVYSLSCNWVYSETGKVIASISIVHTFCDVVYETKVRPEEDILDYNWEQSGLADTDFWMKKFQQYSKSQTM